MIPEYIHIYVLDNICGLIFLSSGHELYITISGTTQKTSLDMCLSLIGK